MATDLIASFILSRYDPSHRPLMVSMQGPQGCGKSTLAAALVDALQDKGLHCAVASLDDFYLSHKNLKALAQKNPDNTMLSGRGPPGTHDLGLLGKTLADVRAGTPAVLPVFDKSLHGGEGDRSSDTVPVKDPDVFILEGWSLGYGPLPDDTLRQRWQAGSTASKHALGSIQQLNTALCDIATTTDGMFDIHVAIRPLSYQYVYKWRQQQETAMKRLNGGHGMNDDEVVRFVDRYMPVYEVFGTVYPQRPTLQLVYNSEREILEVIQ